MTEPLSPEQFSAHLDKGFAVRGGHHVLRLAEIDIAVLGAAQRSAVPRQPFTLIFHGPRGDLLPEGLYTFEVEGGPSFELYVIPVQTAAADRQDYQAVFN